MWLIQTMNLYKVDKKPSALCKNAMKDWKTELIMWSNSGRIEIGEIEIRSGIYQDDKFIAVATIRSMFNNFYK